MTAEEKIAVTRVSLEHTRTEQQATCATLTEANAVLTRWSWSEAGEPSPTAAVYCVVHWADGTRLVVRYDIPPLAAARADLGAAIRAQCAYSAGRQRPSDMTPDDYQRLIWGAGRKTIERYERMLDTLEM